MMKTYEHTFMEAYEAARDRGVVVEHTIYGSAAYTEEDGFIWNHRCQSVVMGPDVESGWYIPPEEQEQEGEVRYAIEDWKGVLGALLNKAARRMHVRPAAMAPAFLTLSQLTDLTAFNGFEYEDSDNRQIAASLWSWRREGSIECGLYSWKPHEKPELVRPIAVWLKKEAATDDE